MVAIVVDARALAIRRIVRAGHGQLDPLHAFRERFRDREPNPPTNPPPLDNHLVVNGVELDGRWPNSAADLGTPMPVVIPPVAAECVAPFSAL
jgi:hypothetical protein